MKLPYWFRKMWRTSTFQELEGPDKTKARLFSVLIVVSIFLAKFIYEEFFK
tara:strand:+ start:182 stop:334 length:153 start_codon:yes stop_codon:yes gene_type:complete